jgi:ATP-dependent helicase/nuclease subunit B
LILGATRAAADDFVRGLSLDGALGLHRMTLVQFAAELAARRMADDGLAPASRLAREAIAARVVNQLHKSGKLGYYAPVSGTPGFAGALAATFDDLRLARIDAGALPPDLAPLFELYEDELDRRKLADLAAILAIAASEDRHPLLGLPLMLLDVDLTSPSRQEFAAAAVRRSNAVFAAARSDDTETIAALERLSGAGARAGAAQDGDGVLSQLGRYLFSAGRPPVAGFDASVSFFSAPGEALECVEIARRIRHLAHDGVPFDSIAILLRAPDRYLPLLEEALRRAAIPGFFSGGVVRPDPAGRAFLALLACAAERCSASRFAEYLSIGQVPPLGDDGGPAQRSFDWVAPDYELAPSTQPDEAPEQPETTIATPIAWERLLSDAAVIGGRDRWERRLRGLEREFELRLRSSSMEAGAEREHVARQLERLRNLERFALPLIEELGALPKSAPWGDWLDRLRALATHALRQPESVLAVLAELDPMGEVGPVELDEVAAVLSERLRFLRREPLDRRYGRVFVGTIEEARGRIFETVFLPGLAEGLFPRRAFEDPLLLDAIREKLSPALRTRQRTAYDERLLLHTAVASAASRFIASYPSMDTAQGRPRVPSFYALEISRAVEGVIPPLAALERRAREGAEARLAWPAPRDAQAAIDDAEFDLAWLAAHPDAGSSRYLMEVNPNLARSLRARYQRWSQRRWTPADGLVKLDEAAAQTLRRFSLTERAYSPSALQQFATCPYRFALYGLFHLRERERVAALEQLDPLTRGGLFHEVQFRFFRRVAGQAAEEFLHLLDILDATLNDVAADYADKLAPAIPEVWRTEIEDLRTDLRGWFRVWFLARNDWEPAHFEFAFGLAHDRTSERDAASVKDAAVVEGYRLCGSIDLIERNRAGGRLRITDHKTGKAPQQPPAFVAGGSVLQPVLYGFAAAGLLGESVAGSRLFYCTQRGGFKEVSIDFDDEARMRGKQVLDHIEGAIRDGFLPAAPLEGACATCDYRLVCGPYEHERVRKKDPDALESLRELRCLP